MRYTPTEACANQGDLETSAIETSAAEPQADGDVRASRPPRIIAEVRKIETASTGGTAKLLLLLISLALFVGAGVLWWNVRMVLIVVTVLLFHEAGHYVAMRAFGYRNVKMFFVPFLGAAVSGRHFHISPWKQSLVYFAGPVPGILLALPLLAVGQAAQWQWMFELGAVGLVLNLLNLLPIIPLDGGWIVYRAILCRSPVLDLVARIAGIGLMFVFAVFFHSPMILLIAIPMMLWLPTTFRVASLIHRQRGQPIPPPVHDEIPGPAIELLDGKLQATPMSELPTPVRAAWIVKIYESLTVPPPNLIVTLAILTLYLGIILLGGLGGYAIFQSGNGLE
ncbi:Peptidase family M50 [Allorhodopirellula solitaria]|uniref:Peptidase family M50 n=2 Tax=Allorhodopirellula solitaria TaxID=2527987 RepID=A0A5C5YBT2_9BACT|nr:Peptidase family M50 [Allorhodopirellula solitaria]